MMTFLRGKPKSGSDASPFESLRPSTYVALLLSLTVLGSSAHAATTADLVWDPVDDVRVAGYELHYGTQSGEYDQKLETQSAEASVTLPDGEATYYFAVRACDSTKQNCSVFSNEISVETSPESSDGSGDRLVVDFTASKVSGSVPLTVTFLGESSGEATRSEWSFGDGETSQGRDAVHTYTQPGTYSVALTVSGPSGSATETRTDLITAFAAQATPGADPSEEGGVSDSRSGTAQGLFGSEDAWRVTEIYVATLGYAPDSEGLEYWLNKLSTDPEWSLVEVAQSFFDQPLVQAQYPDDSDYGAFIESLYLNIFDRSADSEGYYYWLEQLESGRIQRNEMIISLIEGGWANPLAAEDMARFGNRIEAALAFAERQAELNIVYSRLSASDQAYLRQAGRGALAEITQDAATRDSVIAELSFILGPLM